MPVGASLEPHILDFFTTVRLQARTYESISLPTRHSYFFGVALPKKGKADLLITAKVVEAGRTLDIEMLDHIIYAAQGFTSIRRVAPFVFALEESE